MSGNLEDTIYFCISLKKIDENNFFFLKGVNYFFANDIEQSSIC